MKKILSLFLLFFLTIPLWAGVTIKGSIVDAADQSPLDFVNITLFKQGSKKPITLVSSDTQGAFVLPSIENGQYNVRFSYVGFTTINQVVQVNNQALNLGIIKMDADSKKLGEVEVVGQGSQMHFDVDKKVFSVDQNIAAAGGSASDVLKNIPSVTVDNQGNVSLRKDGSVEVWINGKASGLTADNRAQVLQQMPAESIESIEVMTNPSAKFNPEGSAGIINIVMKQNHKAGYYGSVSAGITVPDNGKIGKNLGASINYTSSKLDAYMNLGYRAMSFEGGGNTNRKNFNDTTSTMLTQNNTQQTSFSGLFMRAGLDYHLNKQNTLGISGFGMAGTGDQNSNIHNIQSNLLTSPPTLIRDYLQTNTGTGTRPSLNLNLDYKHDFDTKGSNIIANMSYSNHNRTGNNNYLQNDSLTKAVSNITQVTDSKNTEYEFKLDYTDKISENTKLEAGWQTDFSNRLSSTSGVTNFDPSLNLPPLEIPSYYDKFNYNEQIHAGYLTYGSRYNKLTFQLGLRAEYFLKGSTNAFKTINTGIDTIQVVPNTPLFHVFPSFYLSYSLPNDAELQFNYSNRVNRPRGQQINPFKNFSDSTNISYGNPDLAPQYSSSLELNYVKSWDAQTLSSSLYYHSTDNVIQNVRFLNGKTLESTYTNISNARNTGLELISKNRIFRILSLTSTLNMYYSQLDSATFISPYHQVIGISGSNNFSWSANVMANFMLSKNFSGQITAEYESAQLISQGTENARFSIDLGIRQTFMDRKLSVSLNVRDLLNSDRDNQTTSGAGFSQTTSSYFHGRMVGATISYNFGNTKPKPADMKKKAGAADMNMEGGGEQL